MDNLQELWETWRLEVLVLCSLILQVFLLLFGSSRKRCFGKLIISLLWATYLLADWVATFALGTISSTLSCSSPSYARIDIMALWAPFLLLHLGGPDTITAFSLEDNQLWLRHAMTLLLQTTAAVHIFIISMARAKLISPAAFIFLAGILKYGERTWALKRGSLKALRGLSTGALEDTLEIIRTSNGNDHLQLLHRAYYFFKVFRKFFLDQILSSVDARHHLRIFKETKPSNAFSVLEIELSFAYDILYTKALVVHSLSGRLLRAACFCSEFIAFFLFLATEKKDYQKADVAITYILLTAALALEIVALASLIFSDWTIAELGPPPYWTNFPALRTERVRNCLKTRFYGVLSRSRRIPLLRQEHHHWSNRIGQYSFYGVLNRSRGRSPRFDKLLTFSGMKEMWNEVRYTEYVEIEDGLKEFISKSLLDKSNSIGTSSEQRRAYFRNRGGWALEGREGYEVSRKSTGGAFGKSILVWHIATDICLIRLDDKSSGRLEASDYEEHRGWSKQLSRYLLYLLLVHPLAMPSTTVSGALRYQHTFRRAMEDHRFPKFLFEPNYESAVNIYIALRPLTVDAEQRRYSVYEDALELARELLRESDVKEMWTTVCEVLLEMLCFAAHHCKGNYHAQMLSYGGELLTFIWFLEAHLGLIEDDDNDDLPETTESSAQPNEKSPLLP